MSSLSKPEILHQSKSIPLPHKNQSSFLPYLCKQPQTSKRQILLSKEQFDLSLSHVHLPRYNAAKDKNLAGYFDNPSVRKRLISLQSTEKIGEREKERTIPCVDSLKPKTRMHAREVSREELRDYIQMVKRRITTGKI